MGLEIACTAPCLHGKHGVMRTYLEVRIFCAMAAHEANRVYCRALGDLSQVQWDDAAEWQRTSALKGVDGVFAGNGPGASHESWLKEKQETGWVYGETKDAVAKTHPCIVPFEKLPEDQQQKDHLFVRTVTTMAMALGYPVDADLRRSADPSAHSLEARDGLQVSTRAVE